MKGKIRLIYFTTALKIDNIVNCVCTFNCFRIAQIEKETAEIKIYYRPRS